MLITRKDLLCLQKNKFQYCIYDHERLELHELQKEYQKDKAGTKLKYENQIVRNPSWIERKLFSIARRSAWCIILLAIISPLLMISKLIRKNLTIEYSYIKEVIIS